MTTGVGANDAAPFNSFSHGRTLAGPDETFVSINNDTVYSIAQVDLSVGPVLLSVPDSAERYYVLQFVDAWTNNFAYVGKRATGTGARDFLLLPPDWEGEGSGMPRSIRFPTRIATIVGRWACDGVDDLPAVHALQDATDADPVATPRGRRRAARRRRGAQRGARVLREAAACGRRSSRRRRATSRCRQRSRRSGSRGEVAATSTPTTTPRPRSRRATPQGKAALEQLIHRAAARGERLEPHLPPVRLQPRLLRGRHHRRRRVEDRRPPGAHRRAGGGGAAPGCGATTATRPPTR